MSLARAARNLGLAGAALLAFGRWAVAGNILGIGCCNNFHCPPPYIHCQERPPCIKFRHACPRPVCDPCHLPHAGYYRPCWQPWPYPPDWSHCKVPPPSVALPPPLLAPPPGALLTPPGAEPAPGTVLPSPRQVEAPLAAPARRPSVRIIN
jgi:hypothetical protein